MKILSVLLPVLALASSAAAQGTVIGYPTPGMKVYKGQRITLQLVRPMSHQGSREVGLVLSMQSCGKNPCPDATQQLGQVLFVGQYKPELRELPGRPYQNFTITIPDFDFWNPGKAEIISTRFHFIGAGPTPGLETDTVQVQLKNRY